MHPLERELRSWEGTPYSPGQRIKGVGTDCVGFVIGVLDALYKTTTPIVQSEGWKMVRDLRQGWPNAEVHHQSVRPGDIMVCGSVPEHFHVYIVGHEDRFWHCGAAGVGYRGRPEQVRVAFRMLGKDRWMQ